MCGGRSDSGWDDGPGPADGGCDGGGCGSSCGDDPCCPWPLIPTLITGLGIGLSPIFAIYLFASSGNEILDSRCKAEDPGTGLSIPGDEA